MLQMVPVDASRVQDASSDSGDDSDSLECGWEWDKCLISDGTEKFVQALQLLGLDMARACPPKLRLEAIAPLGTPCGDLLIGVYGKGTTKERLLKPSLNSSEIFLLLLVSGGRWFLK